MLHEKSPKKTRSMIRASERVLVGPIGLDEIPQITCFLPEVQGNYPRDPVSHPRLILVRVKFRTAGEVESGVTGLGQDRGVLRRLVVLYKDYSANVNIRLSKEHTFIVMRSSADMLKTAKPTSWKPCNQACPV